MGRQAAADTPWSLSSNSLVGEADLDDRGIVGDLDWRTYLRHLPSKDDLKTMLTDVKETFKSEIASMRQDIKDVAGRVEMMEEAHEDIREFTSQLYQYALTQTLRESRQHLEDLNNRGQRNNTRVQGLPEAEGSEDVPLILENIFNECHKPCCGPSPWSSTQSCLLPRGPPASHPASAVCSIPRLLPTAHVH